MEKFNKPKPKKNTNASMLFPEIQRELLVNPSLSGTLHGLFVIEVLEQKKRKETWYLAFYGHGSKPTISKEKPQFPDYGVKVQVCIVEIEDKDILKFVTGGLHGLKAFTENRVKIAGDLALAVQLEDIFRNTGGVEKAKLFLKNAGSSLNSKL